MTKVPHTPPADLSARTPAWAVGPSPLWQVADSRGRYPAAFGQMRSFGPLSSARFDPHPEPPAISPTEAVLYAAQTLLTALAERFQHNREIRREDPAAPVVYGWQPIRPLHLIDLTGVGAMALGAAHAISGYRKDVCRRWARAIRAAWPDADGLLYASAMTEQPCVALWAPARDSFPGAPRLAMALSATPDRWQATLRAAAATLRYTYA